MVLTFDGQPSGRTGFARAFTRMEIGLFATSVAGVVLGIVYNLFRHRA